MAEKPLIKVTRPIHQAGLDMLQKHCKVVVHSDQLMSERELCTFVEGADAIVSLLTEPITESVLEAAGPQLKIVAQYAVGFDNIDLKAAHKRGVYISNTPGVLSGQAVAEHVFMLMFALARHTLPADQFMRAGKYKHWDPTLYLGQQLSGKTVGIIGTGQIGSIFASMCHNGLKMKVLYHDLQRNHSLEKELGASQVSLKRLLVESDVVSLHVPLLPATRHLIGEEELELMKPTALLINTARGPVIDEKALVQALKKKQIYGAGLDVYEFEPKLTAGLAALENVILTPHTGSATETTRIAMAECVARNVLAVMEGKAPLNEVK